MAPNWQIRRSGKISSPARNLMGHQRHTQIVPECVCRLLSTPQKKANRLYVNNFWCHNDADDTSDDD